MMMPTGGYLWHIIERCFVLGGGGRETEVRGFNGFSCGVSGAGEVPEEVFSLQQEKNKPAILQR